MSQLISKREKSMPNQQNEQSNTQRHRMAHQKGGFNMSYNGWEGTKDVTLDIVKLLSGKLLKGQTINLLTFKKPVKLCKELTFLEAIANENSFCQQYLTKAAASYSLTQMKNVIAFLVAGYHLNPSIVGVKCPLEPLLGESYSAVKPDGTQLYSEVIGINPQLILTQIYGPNNSYKLMQKNQTNMSTKNQFNTLISDQQGYATILFKDGNEYVIRYPQMIVTGLIVGERIMNLQGNITIECSNNHLSAEVRFAPMVLEGVGSKLKGFFQKEKRQSDFLPDQFNVVITSQGEQVAEGCGSWLQELNFDGQILWNIDQQIDCWTSSEVILPSDSKLRQDRNLMVNNQIQQAEKEKRRSDDQDEQDEKLRLKWWKTQNKLK